MAINVNVRKVGKEKWVKMDGGKNTEADYFTPAYARRLAARLLVAANMAELVIFSRPRRSRK